MSKNQIHDKFKFFIGSPGESGGTLHRQIEAFAADGSICPKSIGVEYLEASNQLVASLGYRESTDAEPGYKIRVIEKPLGKFPKLVPTEIEAAMSKAAKTVEHVICHEFYVQGEEFVMFLMAHG